VPSLWEILSVLVEFIPQVFLLYFILALLDKSGVLAFVARFLHLPINNVLPLCLTFNCTTMAVCAAHDNPQRKRLACFLSLIPCTAQLPMLTFLLLSVVKFPFWSILLLYLICILLGIAILCFTPQIATKQKIEQKVKLSFPNLWQCFLETLRQTLIFAKKIFIAFAVSAFIIVFLARFSFAFKFVTNYEESILFSICGVFAPLFAPIGLNQPVIICALLFGIIAKEAAVSVLLFFPNVISTFTLPVVLSLVTFFTLYPKCLAAQTAINHHCGRKTGTKIFFTNLLLAYVLRFVVYNLCGFIV
ncbi:MAG: hypothetical protein IJ295_01190, partial [Clostridia bacterium]|nr:hypothetical protein [Clostridia bacterium]